MRLRSPAGNPCDWPRPGHEPLGSRVREHDRTDLLWSRKSKNTFVAVQDRYDLRARLQ